MRASSVPSNDSTANNSIDTRAAREGSARSPLFFSRVGGRILGSMNSALRRLGPLSLLTLAGLLGGLGCSVQVSGSASMGSSTPDKSRSDAAAKSDTAAESDANGDATEAPKSDDGDDDNATPEATPPKGDAEVSGLAGTDPANDVVRTLVASIDKGDTEAMKGLVSGRSGLTVDGEALTLDKIDRALMAKLAAPAEGGPAPRVAFRCEPPKRKGVRSCAVFQSQGSWTVELRGDDAGNWRVHALTFTAGN